MKDPITLGPHVSMVRENQNMQLFKDTGPNDSAVYYIKSLKSGTILGPYSSEPLEYICGMSAMQEQHLERCYITLNMDGAPIFVDLFDDCEYNPESFLGEPVQILFATENNLAGTCIGFSFIDPDELSYAHGPYMYILFDNFDIPWLTWHNSKIIVTGPTGNNNRFCVSPTLNLKDPINSCEIEYALTGSENNLDAEYFITFRSLGLQINWVCFTYKNLLFVSRDSLYCALKARLNEKGHVISFDECPDIKPREDLRIHLEPCYDLRKSKRLGGPYIIFFNEDKITDCYALDVNDLPPSQNFSFDVGDEDLYTEVFLSNIKSKGLLPHVWHDDQFTVDYNNQVIEI